MSITLFTDYLSSLNIKSIDATLDTNEGLRLMFAEPRDDVTAISFHQEEKVEFPHQSSPFIDYHLSKSCDALFNFRVVTGVDRVELITYDDGSPPVIDLASFVYIGAASSHCNVRLRLYSRDYSPLTISNDALIVADRKKLSKMNLKTDITYGDPPRSGTHLYSRGLIAWNQSQLF